MDNEVELEDTALETILVCPQCGTDELVTIETKIANGHPTFRIGADGKREIAWEPGADVGDGDFETVGIGCGVCDFAIYFDSPDRPYCAAEVSQGVMSAEEALARLLTVAEWQRLHPEEGP